ncbi:histone H3 acetyltransferase [Blastocystis sp. subtype 4]|uniref:histone H3 acetyltransferase n=1 Tax=Blastocystis sp. subtype 4 TaxID=944170 RepID=UPI000711E60E|nr:histone H3 acetyltransferase [Blastocystis sp. subtype 4]KNB46591.1 histone H3 acetyltransferase [Blastocystis sp. subtype 4]|eukprot:XP_014530034.1 histone H3 acetyltransferase [Blastocystis sp. subtype 4]
MNDKSVEYILVCEYLYERYEERYFEKQDLSLQVVDFVMEQLRDKMQSKNASVKESEIRRFVNNLVNIHTPLLDTWFDRDHVEVPGIPDDQQTDYVSHDSASGVQSLISISKEEAAPLLQESVNEQLFVVLYYQIEHYQHCRRGCSVRSLVIVYPQTVQYCVWFRRLVGSFYSPNASIASSQLVNTLRVALAHKSYCTSSTCSLCQSAREYEKSQVQLLSTQQILVSIIPSENFRLHAETIRLSHSPIWNSSLRSEIGLILDHIKYVDAAQIFAEPVDISSPGCNEYYQVILNPIDLHTMSHKNSRGEYHSIKAFKQDFDLMISNCLEYNYLNQDIITYAKLVQQFFENDYSQLQKREHNLLIKHRQNRETRICSICHGGESYFKPSSLHCDICLCSIEGSMRYVMDPSFHSTWCLSCYETLPNHISTGIGDIEKTSLRLREIEQNEKEQWICCSHCNRWYHTICVLIDHCSCSQKFVCPSCVNSLPSSPKASSLPSSSSQTLPSLQASSLPSSSPQTSSLPSSIPQTSSLPSSIPQASSLPSCHLSDFIESRLKSRIHEIRQNYANSHNMSLQDTPCPDHLTVRVLCNEVEPLLLNYLKNRQLLIDMHVSWYFKELNLPKSLAYNQKCICVFQNHLNIDVLVFVLFVFECPYDCMFNQRTAYISYIDSVTYITPSSFRKVVNQSVIISYLEYLQQKGYNRVSIWMCPSTKGDDYIFFSHPSNQYMPKKPSLIRWYMELLNEANSRGIVSEVCNLVDMYLTGRFGIQ